MPSRGEIGDFTGISSPFEEPQHPALRIDTTNKRVDECVDEVLNIIEKRIKL